MLRFFGFLLCVLASNRAICQVVINEILYRPSKTAPVEFIELHNPGPSAVDLSSWRFSAGVRFVFPDNTSLPVDGYLVLAGNTNAFRREFGLDPFAAFEGRLSRRGETLTLEDRAGRVIDKVDVRLGFPWPTPAGDPPRSIELVHPGLDNGLGASWRNSRTPGRWSHWSEPVQFIASE